jgi:hypothetical protein
MYMNTYMTSKKEARQRAWLRAAARADAQCKVHQREVGLTARELDELISPARPPGYKLWV